MTGLGYMTMDDAVVGYRVWRVLPFRRLDGTDTYRLGAVGANVEEWGRTHLPPPKSGAAAQKLVASRAIVSRLTRRGTHQRQLQTKERSADDPRSHDRYLALL